MVGHGRPAGVARDPIPTYRERLSALGFAEDVLAGVVDDVGRQIDEATEFAKAGAEPDEGSLFTEVWADGGSAWRN